MQNSRCLNPLQDRKCREAPLVGWWVLTGLAHPDTHSEEQESERLLAFSRIKTSDVRKSMYTSQTRSRAFRL
jgi:hypothetical protein